MPDTARQQHNLNKMLGLTNEPVTSGFVFTPKEVDFRYAATAACSKPGWLRNAIATGKHSANTPPLPDSDMEHSFWRRRGVYLKALNMAVSTRRTFLKTSAAAGLAASYARAQAQAPKITNTQLGDNLYLLGGAGGNVIARTGADGVVLVDGGLAENADALAQAVAALPNGGKINTLFNTHWHPEQTGSNLRLGTAGATIIAQENTRLWLQQNITWPWNGQKFKKFSKIAQPNKTFYDKGTLDAGIRYGYISDAAHTDGDLYVYFPQQNVLAVGDAVSGQGWPVVDWWTGGWIGGIVGGLQRIQTIGNKDTKFVPGRGGVLSLAEIAAQLDMYGTIFDRLNQMLNKGHSPSEGVEAKPAKEYEAKMGNPDEFIRRSFESLWAYQSPDA